MSSNTGLQRDRMSTQYRSRLALASASESTIDFRVSRLLGDFIEKIFGA